MRSGSGSINTGNAAHKVGAATNGPRPRGKNGNLTPEQIKHLQNGVWLCAGCANLVDKDQDAYPVSLLSEWQSRAEALAIEAQEHAFRQTPMAPINEVCIRAERFYKAIRQINVPDRPLEALPIVTFRQLHDIKDFLSQNSTFRPCDPLHGLASELVSLQLDMLRRLREIANFVERSGCFEQNHMHQQWQSKHVQLPEFAQLVHLQREFFSLNEELGAWVSGDRYYGPYYAAAVFKRDP